MQEGQDQLNLNNPLIAEEAPGDELDLNQPLNEDLDPMIINPLEPVVGDELPNLNEQNVEFQYLVQYEGEVFQINPQEHLEQEQDQIDENLQLQGNVVLSVPQPLANLGLPVPHDSPGFSSEDEVSLNQLLSSDDVNNPEDSNPHIQPGDQEQPDQNQIVLGIEVPMQVDQAANQVHQATAQFDQEVAALNLGSGNNVGSVPGPELIAHNIEMGPQNMDQRGVMGLINMEQELEHNPQFGPNPLLDQAQQVPQNQVNQLVPKEHDFLEEMVADNFQYNQP